MTLISTVVDAEPASWIASQEYLPLSEVRTFSITRVLLLFPFREILALAIPQLSSFVHRIFLVASSAWQVSVSRSPSISKEYGFEEIIGFSEDKMQSKKCYSQKFFIGN